MDEKFKNLKYAEIGSVFAIKDNDMNVIDEFKKISNRKRCYISVYNRHAPVSAYDIWSTFSYNNIIKRDE